MNYLCQVNQPFAIIQLSASRVQSMINISQEFQVSHFPAFDDKLEMFLENWDS